ncbi:hypothetical protein MPL3365_170176 [Mesorhizobium plurifarium]|uniref:Uncharacterized protein n=1 Tax=Mesorhizobium plurifarium TaxID=69974 RepID=A0A090GTE6_MESPL|nr:hypothetical protein MPL3365_170176 [Mesorhizobium plurifarium]
MTAPIPLDQMSEKALARVTVPHMSRFSIRRVEVKRYRAFAQAFSHDHFVTRIMSTWAASQSNVGIMPSPAEGDTSNALAFAGLVELRCQPQDRSYRLEVSEPLWNVDRRGIRERHHGSWSHVIMPISIRY